MPIPWNLVGASQATNPAGRVAITQNLPTQKGAMWNPCQIDMLQNWDMTFKMNFGTRACGGDGMAFVLQTVGPFSQIGNDSGEHGYTGNGYPNALGIEFDTYNNPGAPYSDPVYDSIGLQAHGNATNIGCTSGSFGTVTGNCNRPQISAINTNIKDGLDHNVQITWDAGNYTLAVSVDGVFRSSWTFLSSPLSDLFGGSTSVYYGFTASSGSQYNYQQVEQVASTINTNSCNAATPGPAVVTPIVVPTNDCGTATPIPTFTNSPVVSATATITPDPTPAPMVCGPPVFVASKPDVFGGCANASNAFTFVNPGGNNTLMVLRVATDNGGGAVPLSVKYGGQTMTLLRSDTNGIRMATYYLRMPPTGSNTGSINYSAASTCSVRASLTVYSNVDQVTPIGFNDFVGATMGVLTTRNATTQLSTSIIENYMAIQNNPSFTATGAGQTNLNVNSGNPPVYCDYKIVSSAGANSMSYTMGYNPNWPYGSQLIEIRGGGDCSTPSNTPTRTPSVTPSITRSVTPSSTPSPSPSATRTATPTVTITVTPTQTPTRSSTLTSTPTVTVTLTPTQSTTRTQTQSSTPTVTISFTPTQTPSRTATATATPSATATVTRTATPMPGSPTSTDTDTPTRTHTGTSTATPTATPTHTPTLSFSATSTPSDSPTRSVTPSPTDSFSPSYTPSETPSRTSSATLTATRTVTPSFTETPSATASQTFSFTATPSDSFTVTPTITITSTYTETAVPAPHQVNIYLYNAAGERVRQLFSGTSQYLPNDLGLSGSLVVTGQVSVSLHMASGNIYGTGSLVWDGSNDAGQYVNSGSYYFRAEFRDPFGSVTSLIKGVQVMQSEGQTTLEVYNSSGELVSRQALPSGAQAATLNKLGADSFAAGAELLDIYVTQNGVNTSYPWDGRNDQGNLVNSGVYTVQLVQTSGGSRQAVQTRSVTVIKAPDLAQPGGTFKPVPNPVKPGKPIAIYFDACPGMQVTLDLYTLAGEHVGQASVDGSAGSVMLAAGNLAPGPYFGEMNVWVGQARMRRTTVKLGLVR